MLSKDELRSLIVQSGARLAESAEFTSIKADLDKFVHRIDNIDGWWTFTSKAKGTLTDLFLCCTWFLFLKNQTQNVEYSHNQGLCDISC